LFVDLLKRHICSIKDGEIGGMGQKGITVIVVEDEPLVRLDIVMSLENEGFIVLEASNADQAIDFLERILKSG
jgi:PleD family two-component response regulator